MEKMLNLQFKFNFLHILYIVNSTKIKEIFFQYLKTSL